MTTTTPEGTTSTTDEATTITEEATITTEEATTTALSEYQFLLNQLSLIIFAAIISIGQGSDIYISFVRVSELVPRQLPNLSR